MKGNDVFNDSSSRWGFKVVEDLGSGMKFTGQFRQNINYEDGIHRYDWTADGRYANCPVSGFPVPSYGRTLSPFFSVAARIDWRCQLLCCG